MVRIQELRTKTKKSCAVKKVCISNSCQRATRSNTKKLSAVEKNSVSNPSLFLHEKRKATQSESKKLNAIENTSVTSLCSSSNFEQIATRSKTKEFNCVEKYPVSNSFSSSHTEKIVTRSKSKKLSILEEISISNSCASSSRVDQVPAGNIESIGLNVCAPKNCLATIKRYVKLENFKKNSIVLAKQKHSIPWPARILEVEKSKTTVYFFGDKREGAVNSSEIYDFKKSLDAIKLVLSSKRIPRGYITGIREIEHLLDISFENSILNQV